MEVKLKLDDITIIRLIENTLIKKMETNYNYIKYTFYELRIKYNLSRKDVNRFLSLLKIKLQNDNYKVYLTGESLLYNGVKIIVQDNELLIAIKTEDNEENNKTKKNRKNKKSLK